MDTKILSTPFPKKDPYGSLAMPVYHTAAYEFETAHEMEDAFTGRTSEFVYSRIANPTVTNYENRVKAITEAQNVLAFNSGMAAISGAVITLAWNGCNIVTSPHLFGNTYSFFASTLKAFGVEARFCDMTNVQEVESKIDSNTCAIFLEIITNPQMEVADLKAISEVCRKQNVPLIADTTVIPFTHFRAKNFGVDIEIVSSTKYISGGATSLGGLVIDYGTWGGATSQKLKDVPEAENSTRFFTKIFREIHRNLGAFMTPETAYLQTIGLETTSLRYEKEAKSCKKIAEKLQRHSEIVAVHYPALNNKIANEQFGEYSGAMFTFDVKTREKAFEFIDRLKLIRRATNLFDNKSLAIHPASTIFGTFTDEMRKKMDVKDTTIRISVGLEGEEDIYDDIVQAL
ncbi:MAG: aminotransferase class I/II-fold pyridoxal phosphate-dependent enzyme [Bacteroidales bacterium]|jgi:O-acetylhomoserine (thiol)-lyase|nr:aminotransferase class I/II-fold pyridoxal phosphate-dependent enzyme [Bacteroidales bacterium]